MPCFFQLSLLIGQLGQLIRNDPFGVLPCELSLKVLAHLNATSLRRTAQVSEGRRRAIREQYIGQKCLKCGWDCLILNESAPYASTHPLLPLHSHRTPSLHRNHAQFKAYAQSHSYDSPLVSQPSMSSSSSSSQLRPTLDLLTSSLDFSDVEPVTHPWKDVYSERSTVERNWRRGRYPVDILMKSRISTSAKRSSTLPSLS
ncbi:hypothetical protein M405DRAFT_748491 [Rhizopogon salebrosus TDB-379]|nr:hypothetical protein M405DRAFT_748491 [Rhizopogon salebrosus TDB-379]